jgi:hypothetical protein
VTLLELQDEAWRGLPVVRRTLAGRRVVDLVVRKAVAGWPVPVMRQCDAAEAVVVGRYMALSIERAVRHEVGIGILLSLVLSAVISEVIKMLLRRWFANPGEMTALASETRHYD